MGDPENANPSTKKRAAGRELSRDNPGLDDEEDVSEQETGTFKKASDEVLATRRIVKVRRAQTTCAPSNPFAGIRLIPPTETSGSPSEVKRDAQAVSEKTDSEDTNGRDVTYGETKKDVGQNDELSECKIGIAEAESVAHVQNAEQKSTIVSESSRLEAIPKVDKSLVAESNKTENEDPMGGDKTENEEPSGGDKTENEELVRGDKTENEEPVRGDKTENEEPVRGDKTENEEPVRGDKTENEEPVTGDKTENEEPVRGDKPVNEEPVRGDKDENEELGEENEIEKKEPMEQEKTENEDKKEDRSEVESSKDSTPLSSFQQLSSSQNAFTGLAGTGFSTSTFSFGNIPKDGATLAAGFGLSSNGSSALFSTSGSSIVSKSEGGGFPSMQEVAVETGEENERVVFNADSVLFEFIDGGWKERGKGELKVNVPTAGTGRGRLLMRARGNYRLILNASLYPDMKLTNMDKKGVTFACMNSTSEGKDGLSTFALKFKDGSIVEEFQAAVTEHKGKASTGLKTPENSP